MRPLLAVPLIGCIALGCAPKKTIGFQPKIGYRYRFQANVVSAVAAQTVEQKEGETKSTVTDTNVTITLETGLNLDFLSHQAGHWTAILRGVEPHVRFDPEQPGRAYAGDELADDLKEPLLIRFTDSGAIDGVSYPGTLKSASQTLTRLLLDGLQCVISPNGSGKGWEALQDDQVGRCRVDYLQSGSSVARNKVQYVAVEGTGRGRGVRHKPVVSTSGTMTYRFSNGDGLFSNVSGEEREEASLTGHDHSTSETTFHVDLQSVDRLGEGDVRADDILSVQPPESKLSRLYEVAFAQRLANTEYEKELGGENLAQILLDVAKLERTNGKVSASSPLFRKLVARLALHPEDLTTVREVLRVAPKDSLREKWTLSALAEAGSDLDQAELVEAAKRTKQGLEGGVVYLLTRVTNPSADSLTWVHSIAEDKSDPNRGSAMLAYGAMLGNLATSEPEEADMLAAGISSRLSENLDPGELNLYLGALGNAGLASTLNSIAPFERATPVATRAEAYQSIRKIDGPEVDTMLLAGIGDENSFVRLSAADACNGRVCGKDLIDKLWAIIATDPSPNVRLEALDISAKQSAGAAMLRPRLEEVAAHNTDKKVRELAQQLLATASQKP